MKYQKKNLWFFAVAGMLSLVMVSACGKTGGEDDDKKKVTPGPEKPEKPEGHTWKLVPESNYNAKGAQLAVANKGGTWLYVSTGDALHAADISKFEEAMAPGKWTKVWVKPTGWVGTAPGQANIDGGNEILAARPTKDGVIVTVKGANTQMDDGAIYFKGADVVAAWNHNDNGLLGGRVGYHVASGGTSVLSSNVPLYGFAVSGAAGESLYLTTYNDWSYFATGPLAAGKIENQFSGPSKALGGVGEYKFRNAVIAQGDDNANAFVANWDGLDVLPSAEFGKAFKLTEKSFEEQKTLGVVTTKGTPKLGSQEWRMDADKAVPNHEVSDVLVVGEHVYIGLKSSGENSGGVVVYDAKTLDPKPVAAGWSKFNVLNLTKDGDKVYAVSANGLVEVKADGAKGDGFTRPATDIVTEADLPGVGITSAHFVGGNLIITTVDKGIVYRAK